MCDTQIDGNVRGKVMINQWIEWAALFAGKPFLVIRIWIKLLISIWYD
jgi:hypothetical protein